MANGSQQPIIWQPPRQKNSQRHELHLHLVEIQISQKQTPRHLQQPKSHRPRRKLQRQSSRDMPQLLHQSSTQQQQR